MEKHTYGKPPIEEATCQFSLADPLQWGPDSARQLFERVRSVYPAMPMQQQVLQANLSAAASEAASGLTIAPTERVVFTDESGESRLSVSAEVIGVHRVKPYISFDKEMLPRLKRDISLLDGQLPSEPFKSIAVRYINKVEIAETSVDLGDYFTHWGAQRDLPVGFDGTITGFFYRTAAQDRSHPLSLVLNFGSVAAEKDKSAFILDIDLTYTFAEPVDSDAAISRIVEVKSMENEIFESMITARTRELFQ
ncbi:MAG TPA: TIGR04255 family protein [Streptosporangiaceae bacterium]|nr:TIGR04255 family protein [Streptosporangiaceae bacterium]